MIGIARALAPVILASLILTGCGGVSEDKPIAEVKAEAQAMPAEGLQAMVDKYKAAIESKKAEVKKMTEKLGKIPVSELMGKEAQAVKGDIEELNKSVRALAERLNVYAVELRKK